MLLNRIKAAIASFLFSSKLTNNSTQKHELLLVDKQPYHALENQRMKLDTFEPLKPAFLLLFVSPSYLDMFLIRYIHVYSDE